MAAFHEPIDVHHADDEDEYEAWTIHENCRVCGPRGSIDAGGGEQAVANCPSDHSRGEERSQAETSGEAWSQPEKYQVRNLTERHEGRRIAVASIVEECICEIVI